MNGIMMKTKRQKNRISTDGSSWSFRTGPVITVVMMALIIAGFFWTPYDPDAMKGSEKFLSPTFLHIMGTDNFGRDILSRVLRGAGTTFIIAVVTIVCGALAGTIIGAEIGRAHV